MEAAVAVVLAATIEVPAGEDLASALARARPGDRVRLGAGEHRGALGELGALAGVSVEGAGAGLTVVIAPEGVDALVARREIALAGVTLQAGPERCALKVLGGTVRLDDVSLAAGACGLFLDGGSVEGRDVDLVGDYGALVRRGALSLEGGSARGRSTGVGVIGTGAATLRRFAIVGPAREGGLSVSAGAATLEAVTIRAPGPSGIAVSAGGRVEGVGVTVAGATEFGGALGDCAQVIRATLRLEGSTLLRCAGAAVEASGGKVALTGVDASGGNAGCIVLVNGADGDLSGNLCAGRGPGLVLASGSRATARVNRWWTDPVLWVDCGSGARMAIGRGETVREPCTPPE